jgi:hypothetical protein
MYPPTQIMPKSFAFDAEIKKFKLDTSTRNFDAGQLSDHMDYWWQCCLQPRKSCRIFRAALPSYDYWSSASALSCRYRTWHNISVHLGSQSLAMASFAARAEQQDGSIPLGTRPSREHSCQNFDLQFPFGFGLRCIRRTRLHFYSPTQLDSDHLHEVPVSDTVFN